MIEDRRPLAWRGPPLALQITGLMLGALVVAQAVTLLLTLFLPPDPPARYGLREIAATLRDASARSGLRREVRDAAPTVSGRGWLSSETSRTELARMLGVSPRRVLLAFYTPLPFAGTVGGADPERAPTYADGAAAIRPAVLDGDADPPPTLTAAVLVVPGRSLDPRTLLRLVQGPGGPGGPGGPLSGAPGGGFPGGGFPGGGFPGGGFPGGGPLGGGSPPGATPPAGGSGAPTVGTSPAPAAPPPAALPSPEQPAPSAPPPAAIAAPAVPLPPATVTAVVPQLNEGLAPLRAVPPARAEAAPRPVETAAGDRRGPASDDGRSLVVPGNAGAATEDSSDGGAATAASSNGGHGTGDVIARDGERVSALQGAIDGARRLLGLQPIRDVEGDFVAAAALPDGRWVVVEPRSDGLLTAWQKRVALWFVIAFGITAPVGWLFARRLSRPLDRFADAAAQLGRDPSVVIAALDGPAEIGRAAHAFNIMQRRLRSFVDDRTAMVGAISHDLRTPLTRMRFRVEDAPDDVREGMLHEVEDMEAMITSVLTYIRDASTPGVRERLDMRTLLEDVAEDAAVIGAEVPIAAAAAATVEVEVMGMRRVLANLVENALKYGRHARIELTVLQDEAVAAVIDDGPGLPDEELEQVFQPFYRTAAARASNAPGTGLGLAVCRSIARAHGGDVSLRRTADGFRAEVRVPLAFDAIRTLAA